MKTMKTIVIATTAITALLVGALTFFSCDDSVALGEKLNLDPPVVTIIDPPFMKNVEGQLKVTGTATDNEEIVSLSVTVERVSKTGIAWKKDWHSDRGLWQGDNNDLATWTELGRKGLISWSITVDLTGAPDGEYAITAGAVNNVNNAGALVERRVIIDNEPPVVKIITPELDPDTSKFAGYGLGDPTVLNHLHNQKIKIQYEVDDSFSIATLMFQLVDNTGDTVYYNAGGDLVNELGWNGTTSIEDSQIFDAGVPITTGKYEMQLVSTATDVAGNSKTDYHGWLVYWPESDNPWTQGVGTDDENHPEYFEVYPGMDVQGQAYDDDGVKQVSLQIFRKISNVWEPIDDYANPLMKPNIPLAEGASPSTFFAWSFTAPKECDAYKIVLGVMDIYDTSVETVRYFYVKDTSGPSVTVDSPSTNFTLFGSSSGAVTILGKAEDGSGTGPAGLKMVWLKNPSSQAYQSSEDPLWNSSWPAAGTPTDDGSAGNMRWSIPLGTAIQNPNNNRMYKDFSQSINIFSDLGISATSPLNAQTFILRVESTGNKAATFSYTFMGDVVPPTLEIKTITVVSSGGTKVYEIRGSDLFKISGPNANPNLATVMDKLNVNDTISLTGTWGDDSHLPTNWGTDTLRMRPFTVTWNGESVPSASLSTGGTWTTGNLTLNSAQIAKGGGRIVANVSDWGDNATEATFSARVGNDIPLLNSISSSVSPGTYKTGDQIPIIFNLREAVSLSGSTVTLTLNTGRTVNATVSGTTLVFNYTVQAGDGDPAKQLEITNLAVTGSNALVTELKTQWDNESWGGTTGNKKLSNYVPFTIDTTTPTLSSAILSPDGQTLTLNFSKAIYKGVGNLKLTQVTTTALPYLAPAVMTKEEYLRYGGATDLGNYYTVGTNGTSNNGTPELTEKYILNYDSETNNTTLTNLLKGKGADGVTVPVVSSAVTISGSTLTVNLSPTYGYILPVKGVSYTLSLDQNFVQDSLNNPFPTTNYAYATSFAYAGVNQPYIRVQKDRGSISGINNPIAAVQPTNANVKIDCQTPGATITYGTNTNPSAQYTTYTYPRVDGNIPPVTITMPTAGTSYNRGTLSSQALTGRTTISLLSPTEAGDKNGYRCGIIATATAPSGGTTATAYEKAVRSVVEFENFAGVNNVSNNGNNNLTYKTPSGRTLQLWLRGGDNRSGDNSTPGFPLSWKGASGIQLLTKNTNNNDWYWRTWEVNANAYLHFIAGTTSTAAQAANGPHEWTWSKNAWTFMYEAFQLHPGESLKFRVAITVSGQPTGTYEFFDSFTESR